MNLRPFMRGSAEFINDNEKLRLTARSNIGTSTIGANFDHLDQNQAINRIGFSIEIPTQAKKLKLQEKEFKSFIGIDFKIKYKNNLKTTGIAFIDTTHKTTNNNTSILLYSSYRRPLYELQYYYED